MKRVVVRLLWMTLIVAVSLVLLPSSHAWTQSPLSRFRTTTSRCSSRRRLLGQPVTTSAHDFLFSATQRGWSLPGGGVEKKDSECERDNECSFEVERRRHASLVPSRRQWIQQLATGATTSLGWCSLWPAPSLAASTVGIVSTEATCDPTVSVWRQPNANRLVYLLGTAHISQLSAQLAGQLVKDVHPGAVFIELDLKRVGGLARGTENKSLIKTTTLDLGVKAEGGGGGEASDASSSVPPTPSSRLLVPAITSASSLQNAAVSVPNEETSAATSTSFRPPPSNRFGLDVGAAAIGSAIRGMYQNLDQAGFKPGDEFVAAVQEGRSYGADIVLGDRDVQITLRRLVQALQATDLQKLMDPNSPLEQSMRELLPSGGGDGTSGGPTSKDDVAAFVESIKTRERVRTIMTQLNDIAPALVQVMLTERDAYMAAGLDSLNQYEVIVAVMGIAHQDGVERNLQNVGWTQVHPKCRPRQLLIAT